ncbi:MAG: DUF4232 domain-containing protein [Acidimicrobiales bacterium]
MRRSRSAVASRSLMVLGLAVLVAGCSHATTPVTTTTAPATTSTSTTLAPTTSTTSTSSTTTTSTQPATIAPCAAGQLKVVALEGTGAAGSIFSPVNVSNTSTTACSLDGRPGITLIGAVQGAKSAPLQTTIRATGQGSVFDVAPAMLTLSPGGSATVGFMVESSDVPSDGEQTCPVVSSMEVTLPGIASSFTVAETFTACGGPTISVSAVVPVSALQST